MNGLTLRISGSSSKKIKGTLAYTPVIIPKHLLAKTGDENILVEKFQKCHSVDEQLSVLKENLNTSDDMTLNFLVIIFLLAEMKHPVKCFLVRYISKNNNLQESFSKALASEILSYISVKNVDCKVYMEIIPRIASCIENFPAGGMAIKQIKVELSEYLAQCLQCCVETLRYMKSLSPTEKNELFNLAHLTLRMLLYIVQKLTFHNTAEITSTFSALRLNIKELLFDEEVPMDTKSVCGILLISMYNLQERSNTWIEILKSEVTDWEFNSLMENDSAKLSLYSAITTVVPTPELITMSVGPESALIKLTYNILAIGEKTSSDSTFTLSVTRTLVQISKTLSKTSDRNLGLQLVDCLLTFVWSHLEHYMDSVRHLTGQVLANIVRYCTELKKEGDDKALDRLFTALMSLDRSRKSYYVSLTSLTSELGASCILGRMPNAICDTIKALDIQAVQASATTALETLLQRHSKETSSEALYKSWVKPILSHVMTNALDSAVLNILENILLQAVRIDENILDYLLPYIKQLPSTNGNCRDDLKCVLMLLSVVRKSNVAAKLNATDEEWKGLISYELLRMAAVNVVDETRILSLSLIVESPKSTEAFTSQELELVLWYLKYNINAQAPNFRQLTLSLMKKFIKRLEDSFKVLKRQKGLNYEYNKGDYYLSFVEMLRDFCYGCLIRGVNYSRRYVALQVLVWCEDVSLEGYQRTWKPHYVENLLIHLEDSYETNKAFALEILKMCPVKMIQEQKHVIGLELDQILRQASSVKPTDCISAAYKLQLMVDRLPESILKGSRCAVPEAVKYYLACVLLQELRRELSVCERCVLRAAGEAPLHGLLHAARHLLEHLHPGTISQDQSWSSLIEQIINTCVEVNAAVACVVNNSSPEGHLPMDMSGVVITDHGNSGNVKLEDGRLVTAQMVLLCAWRSVKEVSLLLGSLSSRMTIQGEEHDYGTLSQQQVVLIGEHFTKLLAETKHRGTFEQAYVGFTKLLSRLWRCRSESLHSLPRCWLTEMLLSIAADDGLISATRRSAGLPFMIQALVSTELQVSEQAACLDECVSAMLRCGGAHASNVLRTLVRCAALQQRVRPHVGPVLLHALKAFDAHTWQERNSAMLLLSALVVRVFGVARARSSEHLSSRNTMTGRMFFLRYPQLYDFMLEKLQEASGNEDAQLLTPSLYPILLLLARLYPSALEGTVSNLKLACFIAPVVSCARSSVLKTRQLAARAIVPLISPNLYIPHIEEMLTLIADKKIKRNFCHGILLQVIKLLDNKPDNLTLEEDAIERLRSHIKSTQWILKLAVDELPCYLLMDEYWKMVNLLIWRFSSLIDQNIIENVIECLNILLTQDKYVAIVPGRDICLANATSLYFTILNKYGNTDEIQKLIYTTLPHKIYEVVLATLNYLLILYNELDIEDKFQEHLSLLRNQNLLETLKKDPKYTSELSQALKSAKYSECKQKCLKVLSLEDDTQKYIIEANLNNREVTDEVIFSELIHLVENEHEKFTHIYLYSLTSFLIKKLRESDANQKCILEAVRVIFACSSSDNSDSTRGVVVSFLERHFKILINKEFHDLTEEEKFEMKATLLAMLVSLLEDDEESLRQRCGGVVTDVTSPTLGPAVGSLCAELVLAHVCGSSPGPQLLAALALLDFRCQVCLSDQSDDEVHQWKAPETLGIKLNTIKSCRVFDQNEKYNVFLEETIWTVACADHIKQIYKGSNICERILEMLNDPLHKQTFDKLCGSNVESFRNVLNGLESNVINPKVDLFVRELRR